MAVLLLVMIYLAFVSLGLPDSLLGVTLPSFQEEWGITLGSGGTISMVVIGGTIIASFLSSPIIKRLGTGENNLSQLFDDRYCSLWHLSGTILSLGSPHGRSSWIGWRGLWIQR